MKYQYINLLSSFVLEVVLRSLKEKIYFYEVISLKYWLGSDFFL